MTILEFKLILHKIEILSLNSKLMQNKSVRGKTSTSAPKVNNIYELTTWTQIRIATEIE